MAYDNPVGARHNRDEEQGIQCHDAAKLQNPDQSRL